MNPHTALCNRILAAVSRTAARVFLNPVGVGIVGKPERINVAGPVYLQPGDYVVRFGQRIEYGLTPGSADIIGITPYVVTAADVGRTLGLFTSLEVKHGRDRLREHQAHWRDAVLTLGGLAGEVRSEQDALELIAGAAAPGAQKSPS